MITKSLNFKCLFICFILFFEFLSESAPAYSQTCDLQAMFVIQTDNNLAEYANDSDRNLHINGSHLNSSYHDSYLSSYYDSYYNDRHNEIQCPDSVYNIKANEYYAKRLKRYRNSWDRLIPKYSKLQFAGGMGVLSIGMGWNYGKRSQWETDIFIGYLPKYNTSHAKGTITIKQNYIPWSIPIIHSGFSIEPLTCGIYFNTIISEDYWVDEPDRYPKHYYGFSTRIRPYCFIGQSVTYYIKPNRHQRHQSVSFYYELNSCDVYIISAVKNSSIKLNDIIKLSLGLKFQIM